MQSLREGGETNHCFLGPLHIEPQSSQTDLSLFANCWV